MNADLAIWLVAGCAIAGVIVRPWGLPEAVWSVSGAILMVALGLLPWSGAAAGVRQGTDVYLFLGGMMLLAELARREGLFDWLAAHAGRAARGSALRLFVLIYAVGTVVTVFLSNDATAVVLTPAVAAVTRAVRAERPLPYLYVCAFIANAASFVLPVSNPANLVMYAGRTPPLWQWLARYAPASLLSIGATYLALWLSQRRALMQLLHADPRAPVLSSTGAATGVGLMLTSLALLLASAAERELGPPTFLAGLATALIVCVYGRRSPLPLLRGVSWSVLPLVAGLFVLVEAIDETGALAVLGNELRALAQRSTTLAAWVAGLAAGLGGNLLNNLPAGLIAAQTVRAAELPDAITRAVLIGVDLGPNLSVTGSLATILWLAALRREGHHVSAWEFLKVGALVMPPALLLALAAALAMD